MELTTQEKRKLIRFLNFICDCEANKPLEEMDEELIKSCVDVLLDLQDKHIEHSPEFINNQVRKIFHPEDEAKAAPETVEAPKKIISKKKIWLVAACIAILVALLSIFSFSSERTVVNILEDFLGTYEFIPFGKELNIGESTYGKDANSRRYSSIEEAVEHEKISLLNPLDENNKSKVKLVSISERNENRIFSIASSDTDLSIEIITNSKIEDSVKSYCNEIITINDTVCYMCSMIDVSQSQAYFIHNNNLYTVTHSSRDELIKVLENMEEIKYEN